MASSEVAAMQHIVKRLTERTGDNRHARAIVAQADKIRRAAEAIDDFRAARSPLDTPAAHTKKLADMARRLDKEITASINAMMTAHREGSRELTSRIDEKVNLRPNDYQKEIREVFRQMKPVDRTKFMADLVDQNRGPELAAIVKAPICLTGIDEELRSRFEQAIVAKHAGAEFDQLGQLGELLEDALVVTRTGGRFTKSLNDPGELARIERAHEAASQAGVAFDQVLAPE